MKFGIVYDKFKNIYLLGFQLYDKIKGCLSNFLFFISLFIIGAFYIYMSGASSITITYSVSFISLMLISKVWKHPIDIKYVFAGLAYLCFWLSLKYSSVGIDKVFWIFFLMPVIYAYLLEDCLSPVIVGLMLSYKISNYVGVRRISEIIATICGIIFVSIAFTLIFYLLRRLINERDQYQELSITDSLTGLSTLQHVLDTGAHMLSKGTDVSVLLVDLDGFKHVNDTYGHLAGNKILTQFADLLKMELAEIPCLIGRFGGDEFIIIMENIDQSCIQKLIERLYYVIRNKIFITDNELGTVKVSCTIGSACWPGTPTNIAAVNSDASDKQMYNRNNVKQLKKYEIVMEQLLQQADRNMYLYKYGDSDVIRISDLDKNLLSDRSQQLIYVLAEKDMYSYIHSQRTAQYAAALAKKLNLPEDEINSLFIAGWLHDVGKICISNRILRKPGKLTADEYKTVQLHVHNGLNMLCGLNISETTRNAIMYHHERWDGMGYPFGVCGDDTPLEGRILQIADTFSALITKRIYKERMDLENALKEISNNKGSQFDPDLLETFLELFVEKSDCMIV